MPNSHGRAEGDENDRDRQTGEAQDHWIRARSRGCCPIDRARLPLDIVAGATLAALAIPEVMGYAKIAGTPVVTGLYTLLLPILAFAILGSSRHLVVGADSATAAILATGLLATGAAAGRPSTSSWRRSRR